MSTRKRGWSRPWPLRSGRVDENPIGIDFGRISANEVPMKHRPRIRIAAILVLSATLAPGGQAQVPDGDMLEWIQAVSLRPTFGAGRSGTRRWTHTPTISLEDASSQETQLMQEVLDDLNEAIAKTKLKKLTLGPPNNKKAEILVHFTLHKNLPALAKSVQMNNYEESWPAFTIATANEKLELQKANVALATDKLEGDRMRLSGNGGNDGGAGLSQQLDEAGRQHLRRPGGQARGTTTAS